MLRTNYVLSGAVLPEGQSAFELRYQPPSLKQGLQLMLVGLLGIATWGGLHLWQRPEKFKAGIVVAALMPVGRLHEGGRTAPAAPEWLE